ncbi:protein phosphatase CheZ [Pseudomonas sp. C27(2019)]|uniref:protein phosphatase CheZ n=1 Tax=Pseudomonas sp. C27(2019) TaxID=2604941 RepID=UPI0012472E80|nr:protein phosphatase CheZ [Pseudomonas sp. C27(2019)]QEY59124.1 protein phosphatase CheZ [Pseudomonas sp. C27(2019)]
MEHDKSSETEFAAAVALHAPQLQQSLLKGDLQEATQIIAQISQVRLRKLYVEVERLTRELHSTILDFDIDPRNPHAQEMSQITDASARLQYVVNMTDQAANSALDLVEESVPLLTHLSHETQNISADWQRFMRREMQVTEFRTLAKRIETFLLRSLHDSNQLTANLNEIMMAQGFQDLTGQVIKRVITLIADIEENLLKLGVMAYQVDSVAGIERSNEDLCKQALKKNNSNAGDGPQIHANKHDDVVTDQVDVDDLLSSLGF